MRKITPKKYAVSLYEALKGVPEDKAGELIKNFISLLAKNKDLSQANKIINAFKEYVNQQENILELSITSVEKLDKVFKKTIIKQLKSSFNKEIKLHEQTDPNLIGGAVLRYGDTVIDGSVRKRIELLGDTLK